MTQPTLGTEREYLNPGSLLRDRYEIVEEIGRGGYSVVYRARDRVVGRDIAVKLLVPPPAVSLQARDRMRREVQAARGLSHPNIVGVHDFLEDGSRTFIVMDYVDGSDLGVWLTEHGPLGIDAAVRLGREMAAALALAHDRGVLHRDIKPPNILLDQAGVARLTDFGSARVLNEASLTHTGGLVGTLAYMPPEVLAGQRSDARADIYALGLTVYVALTGRLPKGSSPHLPAAPPAGGFRPSRHRENVPEWLDDVIAQSTAAAPGDRFPAATGLGEALSTVTESELRPRQTRTTCLICGAFDPLGRGMCARCGGDSPSVANTLVFVRRRSSAAKRRRVANQLQKLLGDRLDPSVLDAVTAGHRPLAQVPASGAERVTAQLGQHAIPSRALPKRAVWRALPLPFYGLLAAVAGLGVAAGLLAVPKMVLLSPLVAALLFAGAIRQHRHPALRPGAAKAPLGEEVTHLVTATVESLNPGSARDLLGDVVHIARSLYPSDVSTAGNHDMRHRLNELVRHACAVARDLDGLDHLLRRWQNRLGTVDGADIAADTRARCERARDRLAKRLLDVLALLTRARTLQVEAPESGVEHLDALAHELETQVDANEVAREELRELLAANG